MGAFLLAGSEVIKLKNPDFVEAATPPGRVAMGDDVRFFKKSSAAPKKKPAKSTGKTVVADAWTTVSEWPDPIAPYVARFRAEIAKGPKVKSTGLTRGDYLKVIAGNVDYFKTLQDANGAIIDPHKKAEWQYSTPCFALAAATLAVHADRKDLLEPAAKAMDWATLTLSQRRAANAHEDFFAPQIAHALPLLKPLVDPARAAKWEANILGFDPFAVYRSQPGNGNWNVVALSGEFLFHKLGLRDNTGFVEQCLAGQGKWFNSPWGMYTEGPMPYDLFPRLWAAYMMAAGYAGPHADDLREVLRRGALTSLFLQSPAGELPAGGRSAHHQWNEAEQCAMYEIYAARALADGDKKMAGVFKRAAHLALGSMKRWIRPSGEMWIVKNHFDPALRHGYESYSAHSQYNLLPMAMLAIAYQHAAATEAVRENPAPADVGGYVLQIGAPFNKVVANAVGMYVEFDTAADPHYNPTGLLRVHRKGNNPQLGPSDGLVAGPAYEVTTGPKTTAAVGPAWKDAEGKWRQLAEFDRAHITRASLLDVKETPREVSFQLLYEGYFGGPTLVSERVRVTPESVTLTAELPNYGGPMRLVWPVLANDGAMETAVSVKGDTVRCAMGGDVQTFKAVGAKEVRVGDERYGCRNGVARVATAEFPAGGAVTLVIRPE